MKDKFYLKLIPSKFYYLISLIMINCYFKLIFIKNKSIITENLKI